MSEHREQTFDDCELDAHELWFKQLQELPPDHPIRRRVEEGAAAAHAAMPSVRLPLPHNREESPEILDACCGGRQWWWDKAHPLALYMDNRDKPAGSNWHRPNWECRPDMQADFRAMPFEDGTFQLVLFDPPHLLRPNPSGVVAMQYGALLPETEQEDLQLGFSECWRVLRPGGTLVFKWAGKLNRVKPHFPATPIVGTRFLRKSGQLGTRWFIFYKPLTAEVAA